jgi:hypothetical protein
MSTEPLLPPIFLPPVRVASVRVEYLGFQNVAEHREFRLRVYGRDGSTEFRFGISIAAFRAGGVSLQDGPDVCYQKVLRGIEAGETASPDVITIDEAELARYREAHKLVKKHRSSAPWSRPAPSLEPRDQVVRRPSLPRRVAPLVVIDRAPGFEEGQRVHHAIFGAGVTAASSVGRTAVCFDTGGTKMFVTSMLEVDVLSAPHTWETSRRGANLPCPAVVPPAELPREEAALPAVG